MKTAWIAVLAVTAAVAAGSDGVPGARADSRAAQGLSVEFLPARPAPAGRPTLMPIRVRNHRQTRAYGVTLVVTAPSWVDLAATRCARRAAGLRCALRDLAPGAAVMVSIRATPSRHATYHVVASASAETIRETPVEAARLPAGVTFRAAVSPISPSLARRMTGVSWRPGCPVALGELRVLNVTYRGFDGRAHTGTLIVHRSVAGAVVGVMRRLYAARFPIRQMVPVDAYGGDDYRSIEADNTSAFNCRPVAGTSRWSEHAYGRAIDLDPLENPYVSDGTTSHPGSRRYVDRSLRLHGMIHPGDQVVRAFAAAGWGWGGTWSGDRDYQHFSATGR